MILAITGWTIERPLIEPLTAMTILGTIFSGSGLAFFVSAAHVTWTITFFSLSHQIRGRNSYTIIKISNWSPDIFTLLSIIQNSCFYK